MKTKIYSSLFAIALTAVLIFTGCEKDFRKNTDMQLARESTQQEDLIMNPAPGESLEIPAATVKLQNFDSYQGARLKSAPGESTLIPDSLVATLKTGDTITEHKIATLSGGPPQGDVLFMFDLTGSMGGELNNTKVNSINIMNAVRAVIPNTDFGLVSHMDYPGSYSGCGYSNTYGDASYGDYAYAMDQSITSSISDVSTAINGLSLGYGADGPENYTRALYEAYADSTIGWRSGSKKIVIAWLDYIPHDCNVDAIIGGTRTTGPDPGRDAIVGTSDDLAILDVLNELADNNITLIALYSGSSSYLGLWQAYAQLTGGDAFQINSNGTIPGGTDIATFIADLIEEEVSHIDELTLEVCTPGFESWLVSVDPAMYTDIDLDTTLSFEFDITITVPEGTTDSTYTFDICLVGDGATYATQTVIITVRNEIGVPVDIKPCSCPNPINVGCEKGKKCCEELKCGGGGGGGHHQPPCCHGVLPVAILGTAEFDVTQIVPESVRLLGLAPIRSSFHDVSTPYEPYIGKPLDAYACHTKCKDGILDLSLKFDKDDVIEALGEVEDRDVLILQVTGELIDGTQIVGEDVVLIIKPKCGPKKPKCKK